MAAVRSGGSRKVGTPQGRVLANGQSRRLAGECHREQTAGPVSARVKRCGKSAPALRATGAARQTPPGARSSRERTARPQTLPGRSQRWMAIQGDPGNGLPDRIPPTGRLPATATGSGIPAGPVLLPAGPSPQRRCRHLDCDSRLGAVAVTLSSPSQRRRRRLSRAGLTARTRTLAAAARLPRRPHGADADPRRRSAAAAPASRRGRGPSPPQRGCRAGLTARTRTLAAAARLPRRPHGADADPRRRSAAAAPASRRGRGPSPPQRGCRAGLTARTRTLAAAARLPRRPHGADADPRRRSAAAALVTRRGRGPSPPQRGCRACHSPRVMLLEWPRQVADKGPARDLGGAHGQADEDSARR